MHNVFEYHDMIRRSHYLKRTRGWKHPPSVIAVAVATAERRLGKRRAVDVVTAWAAEHRDDRSGKGRRVDQSVGTDVEGFWKLVRKAAHSGGQHWIVSVDALRTLTLLGLWERLEDGRLELCGEDWRVKDQTAGESGGRGAGYCVTENPPTVIFARVPGEPGRLILLDWRNWGAGDWAELVAGRGCDREPGRRAAHYARQRATALADGVDRIKGVLAERSLGRLQFTVGSQAMYSFKSKHMSYVPIVHTNPSALELERAAQFGGRNEVYGLGRIKGPVYELDFRSFYVEIMCSSLVPVQLEECNESNEEASVPCLSALSRQIREVEIFAEEAHYPFRPRPKVPEIVYPIGNYRTVLCGPELVRAWEDGVITALGRYATYTMAPALQSYGREMLELRYAARDRGDKVLEAYAKSLGVCLPGKFGQAGKRWVDCGDGQPIAPYQSWYRESDHSRMRSIAWRCQREEDGGEHPESVPAIAAWVTSIGRVRMMDVLRLAGREETYYCDTDSLFVSQEGFDRLESAGRIGKGEPGVLRLVARHEWMSVHGLKFYSLPGRRVCAGEPKGKIIPGESEYSYWWHGGLNLTADGSRGPSPERLLREYRRVQGYAGGVVGRDGTVSPKRV